ncbi:MAG: prolipoprotein diacylglyceryl transferase [Ruminococcaceae bacterium]|nr:prolipoprotein diacylglyceryl transferase [Oscillospiraceae bacterium]
MTNTIAFPGLGIGPFTLSRGFTFFGLTIHWYGILIALGIVLAYLYGKKKAKERDISSESLLDIILLGLPSAIIGARLYYVIFSWADYRDDFLSVFKIWEGGLAIYGGIIGAFISTLVYCRVKKLPLAKILDVCAFGLLIGQILGRWGNFVNAEAYGSLTETALLRMQLVDRGITVHPTFLYESLWNLMVFFLLHVYEKRRLFDGEIFLAYLSAYGTGRFFIEGMRQDSLWLGPVRISQCVAALCVVLGVIFIIRGRRRARRQMEEVDNHRCKTCGFDPVDSMEKPTERPITAKAEEKETQE